MTYRTQDSLKTVVAGSGIEVTTTALTSVSAAFSLLSPRRLYVLTTPATTVTLPVATGADVGKSIGVTAATELTLDSQFFQATINPGVGQQITSGSRSIIRAFDTRWFTWNGSIWVVDGLKQALTQLTLIGWNERQSLYTTTAASFAAATAVVQVPVPTINRDATFLRLQFSLVGTVTANGSRPILASLAVNGVEIRAQVPSAYYTTYGATAVYANGLPAHLGFQARIDADQFSTLVNPAFTWPLIFSVRVWGDGSPVVVDPSGAQGGHARIDIWEEAEAA